MPHVKGNKFKPKAALDDADALKNTINDTDALKHTLNDLSVAATAAAASAVPSTTAQQEKKKTKKKKRERDVDDAGPVIATVVAPPPNKRKKKKKATDATPAGAQTSNWSALQTAMAQQKEHKKKQPRVHRSATVPAPSPLSPLHPVAPDAKLTRVVGLDCEMVGAGPGGERSLLARVSIVNAAGDVLLDSFAAPSEPITDYRTVYSGVRPEHLRGAPPHGVVRASVRDLLKGRVVVGHALSNDFEALQLDHPPTDVRDTARYPPLMKRLICGKLKPQSLRHLAEQHLALGIQVAEHCPVEDARAALAMYKTHKGGWEAWLAKGGRPEELRAPRRRHRGKAKAHHAVKGEGGGNGSGNGNGAAIQVVHRGRRRGGASSSHALGTNELAALAKNDFMSDL